MESMLEFLRSCVKHADLNTITKGDMKKLYLTEKGLFHFSKDDKKLFSEAIRIALKEVTSENKISNVENEFSSKGEDMVTDEVSENIVNGNPAESDSDVDFAPDNIEKCSSIKKTAFKKKSGREILSDSEMSADEQDESNAEEIISKEKSIGTDVKDEKNSVNIVLSEDENSVDTTFRIPKKSQKIVSDDESSLDLPIERKSLTNGHKRFHSSSSSENDANSSQSEDNSPKSTTPKRKKIKVLNGIQEKKSREFSLAKNKSKDKGKIIISSDSEDKIVSKPIKKTKSKALNKSVPKSAKKNVSDSEEEPLENLKQLSSNALNHSENDSNSALVKIELGKSRNELDILDTSESENEPLTNFSKKKLSNAELEDVTKPGENTSSGSEEDVPSKAKSPNKNRSSESEDEPIINLGKKSKKVVKISKKAPNKKSSEKKELSDSDDEPLGEKFITSGNNKKDKSSPLKNSSQSSCSSADENQEQSPISKKESKPSKEDKTSKSVKDKKRLSASENKIEHLKKYVRAAGIRVKSYTQLFEKCKSMKAKSEKLLELLEQHGMKGRPTLEKCKKLKKKIETKKEIAELDLSNILKTDGRRSKRSVCSDATNCKKIEKVPTPVKKFSRLQDIVDSEESD